ncbi:hypothetical protein COOONC_25560 [Cooperia oncophora]
MNKANAAKLMCDRWFDELAKYGVGKDNVFTKKLLSRPNMPIGHYTQMVWQNTYKLGCAIEWCDDMTYGVCQYSPSGNYIDQLIYEKGEPCKNCKCPNCKCDKNEGLCIMP